MGDSDDDKMARLPLLDGAAFVVVDQMSDDDRKDSKKVKAALETAFAPSTAEAYHLFVGRRLALDEPVDIFVADLQRLLKLSKHTLAADGKDPVLIEQFLSGLPAEFSRTLRLEHAAKSHTLPELVTKARVMQASGAVGQAAAAAAARVSSPTLCFACGQVGHMKHNCPRQRSRDRTGDSHGQGRAGAPPIKCYKCKQPGHIKRNCPTNKSTKSGSAAALASAEDRTGLCLAMPHSACNGLVRVAVDVSSDGGAEWSRHASVVDTGYTTSLVELALVRRLGLLHSVRDSNESLLMIQGHALNTSGCVDVMMRRLDGHVYLPHICATLVVVEDLAALNTNILLGADIAAKTGGVNIAYETPGGRLSSVVFGTRLDMIGTGVASSSKLSRRMSVKENDDTVTLEMTDVSVTWSGSAGYWEAQWTWKDGAPPSSPLGCGIGEYPHSKLPSTEEECFLAEVESWLEKEWLVPYDTEAFGEAMCVLPFLAVSQPHKETTPVRPYLDYHQLNQRLVRSAFATKV